VAETTARDAKLVQYLTEAYGKEKQLETALQAHIGMAASRAPYKKRLQQHLKETKNHGRQMERRIKALGGSVEGIAATMQDVANKALAAAAGPLHAVRGTGEQEKLLKNAKTEYQDEAEEIATYTSIITLSEAVGDKETAKVAKAILREEERMSSFLAKLIPQLTKAVVTAEIPARERRANGRRTTRRRAASGGRARTTARASGTRKTAARSSGARAATGTARSTRSGTRASGTRSSGSSRSSGTRSSGTRSSGSSRSSGSRASGSRRRSGS
jgi:ferritin-like metal-binding protein YciE